MDQSHETGLAFDEGADRRAVVVADDEVTLPVPGFGPVEGREGPVVDGQHRLLKPWPPGAAGTGVLGGDHDRCAVVNVDAAPGVRVA